MDRSAHYYQLVNQGRDAFLRDAAPAVLVRRRDEDSANPPPDPLLDGDETMVGDDLPGSLPGSLPGFPPGFPPGFAGKHLRGSGLEVYPLTKKPGAPFAEMITVGRTANNDVCIGDITISRFHAFFKQLRASRGTTVSWVIADSGSKNGTQLNGVPLGPRIEKPIAPGDRVRLGDIKTVFYDAAALFDILCGSL